MMVHWLEAATELSTRTGVAVGKGFICLFLSFRGQSDVSTKMCGEKESVNR